MTAPAAPRVAFLCRGGSLFVGLETDDLEIPGLRYPAIVQFVAMPGPGAVAGSVGITTLTTPVALPTPWLPCQPGEVLISMGAEDLAYPVAAEFVPNYLALIDRIKSAQSPILRPGLFARGR
jgi:hypothetical protein